MMFKISPVNKSECLLYICESNYNKLIQLIPNLFQVCNNVTGHANGKPDLHLTVTEKSPYTLTIELSHRFDQALGDFLEPAVKLRLYLDARAVEVISDHHRREVYSVIKDPSSSLEIMNYKWSLNYFLVKWLDHCLQDGYQFKAEQQHRAAELA